MRAYTAVTGGTSGFSNDITVKVALLGLHTAAAMGPGTRIPVGVRIPATTARWHGVQFGNVAANNPIQPNDMGVYEI